MNNELCGLYIVPTPLGHLQDLSRRAESVLRSVAWVAAEDTRHTAPLLKHLGSGAKLLAAHQHNEHEAAASVIARLSAGESVALVSDAGTPGISDPGARLVAAVRAAGHPIIPLPGPCALTTALSASGFLEEQFLFYGFLPNKSGQRRQALSELRTQKAALIFYEAPHRVMDTVTDLAAELGDGRELLIARELTKMFESIQRLPLSEAAAWLQGDPNRVRGEFVLIVSGAKEDAAALDGARVLRLLLADDLPLKQAARLAAAITGASRNDLYAQGLAWREADSR